MASTQWPQVTRWARDKAGSGKTDGGSTVSLEWEREERLAMRKYGITDIRLFFENDPRFLDQFC